MPDNVSFTCSNCSAANPLSAQFCQNCGAKLAKSCPKCEAKNAYTAQFCLSCGQDFSVRYHGLTIQRSNAWHQHFMSFPSYARNYEEFTIRNRKALSMRRSRLPNRIGQGEKSALMLLVEPRRDWCITKLTWNGNHIRSGLFSVGQTIIAAWDTKNQKDYRIPLSHLKRASFKRNSFKISGTGGLAINFSIKTNEPGGCTIFAQWLDIFGSMFSSNDHAHDSIRLSIEGDKILRRQETSKSFILSVFNLVSEILHIRS